MSILELIVILVGGSVVAVQLYGAYRFWIEDSDKPTEKKGVATSRKPVPSPVNAPLRAAA